MVSKRMSALTPTPRWSRNADSTKPASMMGGAGPLSQRPGEVFTNSAYKGKSLFARRRDSRAVATVMWGHDEQKHLLGLMPRTSRSTGFVVGLEKIFGAVERVWPTSHV